MFLMMDSVLVTLSMKTMMMIRNVVIIVPAAAETKSKRIYISLLLVLVKVKSTALSPSPSLVLCSFQSALVVYSLC